MRTDLIFAVALLVLSSLAASTPAALSSSSSIADNRADPTARVALAVIDEPRPGAVRQLLDRGATVLRDAGSFLLIAIDQADQVHVQALGFRWVVLDPDGL